MDNNINKIKGSTMVEYVMIIGLIGAGAIVGLTSVGNGITAFFTNMDMSITNQGSNF